MINTKQMFIKINCILLFASITLAHLRFFDANSNQDLDIFIDVCELCELNGADIGEITNGELYHKVNDVLVVRDDRRTFKLLFAGRYIDDDAKTLADEGINVVEDCDLRIEFGIALIATIINSDDPGVQCWFDQEMDSRSHELERDDTIRRYVDVFENIELEFFFKLKTRMRTRDWNFHKILENNAFNIRLEFKQEPSDCCESLWLKVYDGTWSRFVTVKLPASVQQSWTMEVTDNASSPVDDEVSELSSWVHVYFAVTKTTTELKVMTQNEEGVNVVVESGIRLNAYLPPLSSRSDGWSGMNCRGVDIFRRVRILYVPMTFKRFRFKSTAHYVAYKWTTKETVIVCILGILLSLIIWVCCKKNKTTMVNDKKCSNV